MDAVDGRFAVRADHVGRLDEIDVLFPFGFQFVEYAFYGFVFGGYLRCYAFVET